MLHVPFAGGDAPHQAEPAPIERAIVVDDDPVIRGILRSTLAGIGLGVHLATDGTEAIAMASRLKVGLFMLDLQMPGTNGLETCRHLRTLPAYARTPIIVLTGHDGPRTQAAALAAGATMFLTKPFKPAALLQTLALILRNPTHDEASAAGPFTPESTDRDPGGLWGQADPEYRNQVWGRLDAERAARRRARGENDLGLD